MLLPTVKKQPTLINVIFQVQNDLTDMRQAKYCSICKLSTLCILMTLETFIQPLN